MKTFIGIDVGTSGTKLLLVAENGEILAEQTENYSVCYPQDGWSEQHPSLWRDAVYNGIKKLLVGQDKSSVKGISFGGQMHGLVVLDKFDNVIRPCILWNDGRTEKQTSYLNETIGKSKLSELTGNIAFAGFTAPKILWLKENEPYNFEKIDKIMLPKDYIAYLLSGEFCTDYSDASGTLLLDVKNKKWSQEMCDICGIFTSQLPRLCESYEVVGTILKTVATELGLSEDVKVIAGAGDNAAAAVGTGTVNNNSCNISLGTSGTLFISSNNFSVDSKNALHSFCHSNGKWHLMGCILSAASCRKWWLEEIVGSNDYKTDENQIQNSNTDIIFLPYLSGERSPHNDTTARGAFIGLSATTTKGDMSRAIMEGVAFAIKDCLEIAKANGVVPTKSTLCGGGAKSQAWRQIVADVLNIDIEIPFTEQGPAYGASILAMVGCGVYDSVSSATDKIIKIKDKVSPKNPELYNKKYEMFKKLYPLLKQLR